MGAASIPRFCLTRCAAIVIGALLAQLATAADNIRFNRFGVDQGLSQARVQAIAQDQSGFIWLGTQQGLNRFDGRQFVQYFHDARSEQTLADDWIWALHADGRGNLWIGTESGGLDRLELETGRFTHFRHRVGDPTSLGSDSVRALAADGLGTLWVGTDGGGLGRIDIASGEVRRYQHDPARVGSLSHNRVKAIHVDDSGYVWVGTDGGGLNRFDPVSESFTGVALDGSNRERVRSVAPSRDGGLWVGTYERGLFKLSLAQGTVERFRHDPADSSTLGSDSIRELFADRAGRLWVGTDSHGLSYLGAGDNGFSRVRNNPGNLFSLADDHVAALFQDSGGVIWVGTSNGVSTWNPMTAAFNTFSVVTGELRNNWVSSFAEHPDGRIWVGTAGGGVHLIETRARDAVAEGVEQLAGLSDDRVFALAAEPDGGLWLGTRAGGLNLVGADGAVQRFRHDPEDPGSLSADGVTSLLRDGDGELWVGTYEGGLNRLNRDSGEFQHYRHDAGVPGSLCSDRVLAVYRDRAGSLWVGSHGGGLCRFDGASGRFESFRHDPGDSRSLSSNNAWALHEDKHGNLWIGTADAGLNLWHAADRAQGTVRFERFDVAQGLASPVVYGLQSDAMGRLWVSSNRGLSRFDLSRRQFKHYSASDGLQGNEFNHASYRARDGRLFFGGTAGFNAFSPELVGTNTHPPAIALTRFVVLNEETSLDELRDEQSVVALAHDVDLIAFEYAALDFTAPRENTYRHRLAGFDADWVEDGSTRRATYTNLAPGDYVFEVSGANNDGVPSFENLTIPLRVEPPPWSTWWAQVLYCIAALFVAFLIYRAMARRAAVAEQIHQSNVALRAEIAEREAKEAALAQTRQKAQRYLDVVEVIILALDAEGRVTLINQKGCRTLGYDEQEMVGEDFFARFVPAEDRDDARERFFNVDQYAYSECQVKPREGPERVIAWHTIPLDSSDQPAGGVLMSGSDVTQMRNLEGQLRETQKMEALGTMAGGVAHDFNNILSSILGYTELSLAAVSGDSKVAEYLHKLESSVDRARDLIHGILTFGSSSRQSPRPVYVASVVDEAMQLVAPVLGSSIDIDVRADEDCQAVMADPSQLMQVMLNLCANAGQAMSERGGRLSIEVRRWQVDVEQARTDTALTPGPHVKLTMTDTGVGMDDYTLGRIFDPFFTTREREEGTGLGLAVVHGVVAQLQGSVHVTSEQGRGSRFEIMLPCCDEQPAKTGAQPVVSVPSVRTGNETILFIDDEPSVVAIAEEALTNLGYRILTARDGAAGLAAFEAHQHEIDLVISDQTMPKILGHQLAERLQEVRPGVPFILMSGADIPDSPHVSHYLSKPFTLSELASTVGLLIDRVGVDS
ncbi:MAG: ATP-binding protein [Gammaproteobacteria bacterium]|nr:ATP-binding protein [Gammaproteobacteria bacterium]